MNSVGQDILYTVSTFCNYQACSSSIYRQITHRKRRVSEDNEQTGSWSVTQ